MSAIVIAGDTSGTITLQAPAVAGNTTITFPSTNSVMITGVLSPNTGVLFADSNTIGASAGFTFNKVSNNVTFANSIAYGGVTLSNAVTGTGSMVLSNAPTITGNLTYGGVTLSNSVTGTGSMVLSASPTLTGNTTTSNLIVGSAGGLTYGGVTLSNSVTGTGSMVLSSSPVLTTPALGTPSSGNLINCTVDGTVAVGYRNIPWSGAADKTNTYTMAAADVGKFISLGTNSSITVPNSTFTAGDIVSLYNNTTGNVTITCSAVTTYMGGNTTAKTSMVLSTRGVASVFFYSSSVCIITGNVI